MANESGILLEYPVSVTGPDGTVLWEGIGFVGSRIKLTSGETSATINAGACVVYHNATLEIMVNGATTLKKNKVYAGLSAANAAGRQYAGVALNKAKPGEFVDIAGVGSVVPVTSLASASLANNAVSAYAVSSATAGTVDTTNTEPTAPAGWLGKVQRIAGTSGGTTDSGSDTQVIVRVTCT